MNCYLVIGFLALTACSKDDKDPGRSFTALLGGDTFVEQPQISSSSSSSGGITTFPQNAEFFILAGQSNMSGEGCLPEFDNHPNVHIVGPRAHGRYAEGYAFGILRHQKTGKPIVLIQCSMGGSSMAQNIRLLWGPCIDFIRAHNIQPTGLLMDQGQAEAAFEFPTPWASQFTNYVSTVRLALNNPTLPIVFAQIGQYGNNPMPPNYQHIKDEQASVMIPYVEMFVTDDIAPTCGGWHYCRPEAEIIGLRFNTRMP